MATVLEKPAPTDEDLRAMKHRGEPISDIFRVAYRLRGLRRNEVREIVFGAGR